MKDMVSKYAKPLGAPDRNKKGVGVKEVTLK